MAYINQDGHITRMGAANDKALKFPLFIVNSSLDVPRINDAMCDCGSRYHARGYYTNQVQKPSFNFIFKHGKKTPPPPPPPKTNPDQLNTVSHHLLDLDLRHPPLLLDSKLHVFEYRHATVLPRLLGRHVCNRCRGILDKLV